MYSFQCTVRRSPFTVHRSLLTVYCLLLTVFLLSIPPAISYSQSPAAPYWQYNASGPLQHVVPVDLDEDGIDDFILVDELGRVTLVNAKGEREWSQDAGAPVTAVTSLPQPITNTPGQAVVLGFENELALLTNYGDTLWRIPITAVDIPLSLLTSSGYAESEAWQSQYPAIPVAIQPYDYDQDGQAEILVLLHSGQLQLFDQQGNLLWRLYTQYQPHFRRHPPSANCRL